MMKRWMIALLLLFLLLPVQALGALNVEFSTIDACITMPVSFSLVYQSMKDWAIISGGGNAKELKSQLKEAGIECIGENEAGNIQFVISEPEAAKESFSDFSETVRENTARQTEEMYRNGGYEAVSACFMDTPYTTLMRVAGKIDMVDSTKHLLQYMYADEGVSFLIQAEKKDEAFSQQEAAMFDAVAQTVQFGDRLEVSYDVFLDEYVCKENGAVIPVHAMWYKASGDGEPYGILQPYDDKTGVALYYEWIDLYEFYRENGWTVTARENVLAETAGMSAMEYSEQMIRAMTANYTDLDEARIYDYDFGGTKFMVSDFELQSDDGSAACKVKIYMRVNERDAMLHYATFVGGGTDKDQEYIYDVTAMLDGMQFPLSGVPQTEAAKLLRKSLSAPYFDENGMAVVNTQHFHYGLISADGRIIADAQWQNIHQASDGLYLLESEKGDCYIDLEGQVLAGAYWDQAEEFREGLANVRKDGKEKYIDEQGNVVIESDARFAYSFSDGMAIFRSQDGKYGCIDRQGNVAIEPVWDNVSGFKEGAARVFAGSVNSLGLAETGVYGFIDKQGNIICKPQWDQAEDFKQGRAVVCKGSLYGCIDLQGNVVAEPEWAQMENYSQGLARVCGSKLTEEKAVLKAGKYGFVDLEGKLAIDCSAWDYVTIFDENGYARIFVGELDSRGMPEEGKYGLINTRGEVIIAPEWDTAFTVQNDTAVVKKNGKYGLISIESKTLLDFEWDALRQESDGLYCAVKDGKFGFINGKGETIIDFRWEKAGNFSGGYAGVMLNGSWYVIDKTGKIVL